MLSSCSGLEPSASVVLQVVDPKASSPYVQLHASNPRKVTLKQGAPQQQRLLAPSHAQRQGLQSSPCPDNPLKVAVRGLPVSNQHPSSPLEVESSPAELDADAAASTSSSPCPLVSPVATLHSAFLSESPSPLADVEAQVSMGPSPDSPKGIPLVNSSQGLTLAKELTPQVTLCPKCCVLAKHCMCGSCW